MGAVFNAKVYPVGIGKHIVCIDADRKATAAIQTACRGEPEPQLNLPWCVPQNERY